jgi:Domain of unknown function (DUF4190)/N-terminal domain of toast_rack, DUF2154
MECPNCGRETDSKFCPDCGAPLPDATEEPTVAGAGEAPGPTPPAPPTPPPPPPPRPTSTRPKTSGFAIASLVMGILGFTCLFILGSVLAIIFGFIARSDIRQSKGAKSGTGMATAGIVLGIVMLALVALFVAVVIPITFKDVGPTRTTTKAVDADGGTTIDARFDINNGNLNITGGAGILMEGKFTYNVKEWRPVVNYAVTGSSGELTVRQPSTEWWRWLQWLKGKNTWDIRLGGTAPINLKTNHSWGRSTLDLGGVNLSALDSSSSAGDLAVRLPGAFPSLKDVRLDQSAGRVKLVMDGDYPTMETLDVENSAGAIDVSLTGNWTRGINGTIDNSAGAITLRLPRDAGVYVVAKTSAGEVNASGMDSRAGDVYVNDSYGKSPVTLKLSVENSAGNIDLLLE